MTGVRYRLTSTSRRAWLFNTGFFGLWIGIDRAVGGTPFWSAVRSGVIAGVLFGSFMAMVLARSRPEALRQLPAADRNTVMRTVQEGTSVQDARLAPATIAYADYLRRQREQAWARPGVERVFFGFLVLFFGYQAVTSGMDGRGAELVWDALRVAIVLVLALVLPGKRRGELQRAEQAERSARALLDRPS